VLGATDPCKALETSIRGKIFRNWQDLGLAYEPGGASNGVHASASPFEGLAERCNWLGVAVSKDVYGCELLSSGLSEKHLKEWSVDPRVTLPDGQEGSIFDALEDTDAEQCKALLHGIAKANANL